MIQNLARRTVAKAQARARRDLWQMFHGQQTARLMAERDVLTRLTADWQRSRDTLIHSVDCLYRRMITTELKRRGITGSVCGYCLGRAEWSAEALSWVHAEAGNRVPPPGTGDYVSARHNRAGTRVLSVDLVDD